MADGIVNFGLVQPEASNAFLKGFQGAQDRQQANALAQLQLRAAQRGEEETLAEREAAKGATSFQDLAQRYQQAGLAKQALAAAKTAQEQRATQITQAKNSIELMQESASKVMGNPDLNFAKRIVTQFGQITGQDISSDLADLEKIGNDPAGIQQWAASHALKAKELLPQFEKFDTGAGQVRMGFNRVTGAPIAQPTTQPAQQQNLPIGAFQGQPQQVMNQLAAISDPAERAAATQAYQRQLAGQVQPTGIGQTTFIPKGMSQAQQETASREQQRIGLEQRRVDLAEKEAARKEAGLAEPLSKQEIQKREAKYPQAKSSVVGFETQADDMIKKLEQLKNHKGLEGILGTVYGRTPSFTAESQAAQALYDQILAKGKFQELQNMRLASPTGGALGNVSNMEIQSLGQAFGALSRVQGKESFKAAIDDVIKQIQSSKERTKEAFDETYQYKQGKPTAVPSAGKAKFLGFE